MYRSLLLALSLLFFIITAKAAVFVVTSNADSGPGTLREALTLAAANGSAEKDFINFNLPVANESSRTIIISSKLPNISSNLVIDGTTQPGLAFGVSNAKVILQPDKVFNNFNALTLIDVDGFELYGFYIRDFVSNQFTFYFLNGEDQAANSVLYVESSKNIQIGAPAKGNVFANDIYILKTAYSSTKIQSFYPAGIETLKLYANFIGFEPDGKSSRNNLFNTTMIDITGCKGVVDIGGDDVTQRNYFGYGNDYIQQTSNGPVNGFESTINIKNNYFNYDVNGQPIVNVHHDAIIYMFRFTTGPYYTNYPNPFTYNIINNKIQFPLQIRMFDKIAGDITFQGNQELNGIGPADPYEKRIILATEGNLLMGGDQPGQGNIIYGCQVTSGGVKSAVLDHTKIYCLELDAWVYGPGEQAMKLAPKINITKVSASSVSGTATPLSKVQLFWDDDCQYCQPETYFSTVFTDANGNWRYDGNIQKGVIATATLNGFTSLFTSSATLVGATLIHASCGENNGSITKPVFENAGGYIWKNENGDIISNDPELKNLAPGKYTLTALNGSCSKDYTYQILDATPQIIADQVHIVQPSCGANTGSITYLYLNSTNYNITQYDYDAYQYKWMDANGKVRSTGIDLTSVEAGTYKLEVTYKNSCPTIYGPITLKNTTGPSIDESKKVITPTQCGQLVGAITNLAVTGTGTIHYSWRDDQNQEVAQTKDLIGKAGGKYTLHVTDDTQCGEVISSIFEIKTDGAIIIDESAKTIQPATCEYDNGSIKGITAPGATIYKWYNANNQPVSDNLDLDGVAPGSYYLVASNANGCSAQSTTFTIERAPRTITGNTKVIKNASCAENNGSITIIFEQQPAPTPASFRWVNHATGANVSVTTTPELTGLDAATYDIYVTEQSGCEYLLASYTVNRDVGLTVTTDNVQVNDDHCQTSTGSIKGINAAGATPLSFVWTDNNNNTVSNTLNLENVIAGTYHITITDGSGCTQGLVYSVNDKTEAVNPPSVTNLDLCTAGNAILVINNANANYSYRLYDDANSPVPLNEQQNGRFAVNVPTDRSYYISQFRGNCESTRAEVKIKVGISSLNIANTFSPNGDGQNDYWKINGIESYPQAVVQVFNRNGQKLFESKGYSTPFNGTYKGKPLPIGTYFYIINLNKNCNLLSGSLTIIR